MNKPLQCLIFAFVLSNIAQAFYDPASGRWVSRDPIGENGGESLYGFVGNSPTSAIDILGLTTITGGKKCVCGPDITAALKATLKDVSKAFGDLSKEDRKSVCDSFIGAGSWDMRPLKAGWGSALRLPNLCGHADPDNTKSCKLTVTIDGECHYGGTVNYVLFGHIGRLCERSQARLEATVTLWKTWANRPKMYPHIDTYPGAIGWTIAGFHGWLSLDDYWDRIHEYEEARTTPGPSFVNPLPDSRQLAPRGNRKQCKPCDKSIGAQVLAWRAGSLADGNSFKGGNDWHREAWRPTP